MSDKFVLVIEQTDAGYDSDSVTRMLRKYDVVAVEDHVVAGGAS